MPADKEMPDLTHTLTQIRLAREAVQDAVDRGRLLMHIPPQVEIDHDIVIWNALLDAKTTINGLADALDRARDQLECAEHERDEALRWASAARETAAELGGELDSIQNAYNEMCDRLREAVERHDLGLGGERLDVLVVDALDSAQRERDAFKAGLPGQAFDTAIDAAIGAEE